MVGDSSGNYDRPEAPPRAGAVDGGRLDQRLRDRLQAGQEEQEVVGDLLPDRGHHDQRHRVVGVEQVVPVDARSCAARSATTPMRGREHEQPQHAGHRRRHRVRPDQQRLVDACAPRTTRSANTASTSESARPKHGDQHREDRGGLERLEVGSGRRTALRSSRGRRTRCEVPNASCCCSDCSSAWPAGQKKNTRMTAICGASSSPGQPARPEEDAFFHDASELKNETPARALRCGRALESTAAAQRTGALSSCSPSGSARAARCRA